MAYDKSATLYWNETGKNPTTIDIPQRVNIRRMRHWHRNFRRARAMPVAICDAWPCGFKFETQFLAGLNVAVEDPF